MCVFPLSLDFSDALALVALIVAVLSWLAARRQNLIALHNERVKLYQDFGLMRGKLLANAADRPMPLAEQVEYQRVRQLSEFYFGRVGSNLLVEAWNALIERDAIAQVRQGLRGTQKADAYRALRGHQQRAEGRLEAAEEHFKRQLRKVAPWSLRGGWLAIRDWRRERRRKRQRRKRVARKGG